jgi:hypothetical protein
MQNILIMTIIGLETDEILALIGVLLAMAGGFYIGRKNPGNEPESMWRQIWTYADIFAVILTALGAAKIIAPLENSFHLAQLQNIRTEALPYIIKVHSSYYAAEDSLCSQNSVGKQRNEKICNELLKIQRQISLPMFNATSAQLIESSINRLCPGDKCDLTLLAIREKADEYKDFYNKHEKELSGSVQIDPEDVTRLYILVVLFILVMAIRAGRSGAEYERNRTAMRKAKDKASEVTVEDRLNAIEKKVELLENGSTAVREPTAVALLGLGILGFALSRRKSVRK